MTPPAAPQFRRGILSRSKRPVLRIEKPEIFSGSLKFPLTERSTENILLLKLLIGLSYLAAFLSLALFLHARFVLEAAK